MCRSRSAVLQSATQDIGICMMRARPHWNSAFLRPSVHALEGARRPTRHGVIVDGLGQTIAQACGSRQHNNIPPSF